VSRILAGFAFLILIGVSSIAVAQQRDSVFQTNSPWRFGVFSTTSDSPLVASANLDQCRNGAPGGAVQCVNAAWVNGNLGANNSHYAEGSSVAYRATLSGLTAGSAGNTVVINYDTTVGGKHAIDYLTSFDRTETNADPCTGTVPGCGQFMDFAIPVDPNVTGAGVTPVAGNFRIYGGTITGVSAYTLNGTYAGASDTTVTVTFTTIGTEAVVAWGGHVSTRADWGVGNSAISINGSPYHMRVTNSGGQDRSINSDAIVVPATLHILKEVTLAGGGTASLVSFPFTATGLSSGNFSLVDNDVVGPDRFDDLNLMTFGSGNAKTVTESLVAGWTLADLACVETAGGLPNTVNSTVNLATRTATIIAERGELITCTFRNQQLTPSAANAIIAGRVVDGSGRGIPRVAIRVLNAATSEYRTTLTNPFGYYRIEDLPVGNFYVLSASSKSYTFLNNDLVFTLIEDSSFDFVGQEGNNSLVNLDSEGNQIGPWSKGTKP
jgi:hypothetical protein